MAKFSVAINSVLGGQAPTSHFAGAGQFRASLGIDPAQPADDLDSATSTVASGLIRPAASEKFSGTTIQAAPLWIVTNPKNNLIYVYDARSSFYSISADLATVTAISDAGNLSNGRGNGMWYHDNAIMLAINTTIIKYGPLDGTPGFTDFWATTLATTALTSTTYPTTRLNNLQLPNHVGYRHSDGKSYFPDIVGNQGVIHRISTTKTTVEGDTDLDSAYNALDLGYGIWPTVISGLGSELAIACYEGSSTGLRQTPAKIAFWDTLSDAPSKIVWVEFPDPIITAMINRNGVLYTASGNYQQKGFRVCRFIGGYSYEEMEYFETGEPPLPGAFDGILDRILAGSYTNVPESDGCVYAVGLQKKELSGGKFNVMRSTGGTSSTSVTAVAFADSTGLGFSVPIIGWTQAGDGSTGASHGLDKQGTSYSAAPSVFWSEMFRVGKRFKLTRIRIPLAQSVTTNMELIPKIYTDDGNGLTFTLTTINAANYSSRVVVYRADSSSKDIEGQNNFWLELKHSGSALLVPNLPITIEGETYED